MDNLNFAVYRSRFEASYEFANQEFSTCNASK